MGLTLEVNASRYFPDTQITIFRLRPIANNSVDILGTLYQLHYTVYIKHKQKILTTGASLNTPVNDQKDIELGCDKEFTLCMN